MTPKEIQAIRLNLGLSYEEFAQLLGVSYNTVWCWCAGRNFPRSKSLRFLKLAQNLSPEEALHLFNKPALLEALSASKE